MPRYPANLWMSRQAQVAGVESDPDLARRSAGEVALGLSKPQPDPDQAAAQEDSWMRKAARLNLDRQERESLRQQRADAAAQKASEKAQVNQMKDRGIVLDRSNKPVVGPAGDVQQRPVVPKDGKVVQKLVGGRERDVTSEPGADKIIEGANTAANESSQAKSDAKAITDENRILTAKGTEIGKRRTEALNERKKIGNQMAPLHRELDGLTKAISAGDDDAIKKNYGSMIDTGAKKAELTSKLKELGAQWGQKSDEHLRAIHESTVHAQSQVAKKEADAYRKETDSKIAETSKLAQKQLAAGDHIAAAETLEGLKRFKTDREKTAPGFVKSKAYEELPEPERETLRQKAHDEMVMGARMSSEDVENMAKYGPEPNYSGSQAPSPDALIDQAMKGQPLPEHIPAAVTGTALEKHGQQFQEADGRLKELEAKAQAAIGSHQQAYQQAMAGDAAKVAGGAPASEKTMRDGSKVMMTEDGYKAAAAANKALNEAAGTNSGVLNQYSDAFKQREALVVPHNALLKAHQSALQDEQHAKDAAYLSGLRAKPETAPFADELAGLSVATHTALDEADAKHSDPEKREAAKQAILKEAAVHEKEISAKINDRTRALAPAGQELYELSRAPETPLASLSGTGARPAAPDPKVAESKRAEVLKKYGITAAQGKTIEEDAAKQDYAKTGKPTATLSDGSLRVSPALWMDQDGYTKAVDASEATPAAKHDAMAAFDKVSKAAAKDFAEELETHALNIPGMDGIRDAVMAWKDPALKEYEQKKLTTEEKVLGFMKDMRGQTGSGMGALQKSLLEMAGATEEVLGTAPAIASFVFGLGSTLGLPTKQLQQAAQASSQYMQERAQLWDRVAGEVPTNRLGNTIAGGAGMGVSMLPMMIGGEVAPTADLLGLSRGAQIANTTRKALDGGTKLWKAATAAGGDVENMAAAGKQALTSMQKAAGLSDEAFSKLLAKSQSVPELKAAMEGQAHAGVQGFTATGAMQELGRSYTEGYDAYIKAGKTPDEARAAALAPALANAAVEYAAFSVPGAHGIPAVFKSLPKTSEALEQAFKQMAKNVGGTIAFEVPRMALDSLAKDVVKAMSYDPKMDPKEAISRALESGLSAGVFAGLTSVLHNGASMWADRRNLFRPGDEAPRTPPPKPGEEPPENPLPKAGDMGAAQVEIEGLDPQSKAFASGLLKISKGDYNGVTADEMTALGVEKKGDKLSPIKGAQPQVSEANGHLIIHDSAIAHLNEITGGTEDEKSDAAKLIGKDEAEARRWAAEQPKPGEKPKDEPAKSGDEKKPDEVAPAAAPPAAKPAPATKPKPAAETPAPESKAGAASKASEQITALDETLRDRKVAGPLRAHRKAIADAVKEWEDKVPVEVADTGDDNRSGLYLKPDGTIVIDPDKVAKQMAALPEGEREAWVKDGLRHEVDHHIARDLVAKDDDFKQSFVKWYEAMPDKLKRAAAQAYYRNDSADWPKGDDTGMHETFAQFWATEEGRRGILEYLSPQQKKATGELIAKFIEKLKAWITDNKNPGLNKDAKILLAKAKEALAELQKSDTGGKSTGIESKQTPTPSPKTKATPEAAKSPEELMSDADALKAVISDLRASGKIHNMGALEAREAAMREAAAKEVPKAEIEPQPKGKETTHEKENDQKDDKGQATNDGRQEVLTDHAPSKAVLQEAPSQEGATLDRVAIGSVDTPAQGVLNMARDVKAKAWKRLREIRQRVKDLGPHAGNARLDLLNAESAHKEAVRMEEGALKAIEKRANELGQTTKAEPREAAPKGAATSPPSLGASGREIWQGWKALTGTAVAPRAVIQAHDIYNGGSYSWSADGELMRDFINAPGSNFTSTTRAATQKEIEGLHGSLDTGGLQIEERRISGVGSGSSGKPSDASKVIRVLHQATGKPLAEWLETPEGKGWQRRNVETERQLAKIHGGQEDPPANPTGTKLSAPSPTGDDSTTDQRYMKAVESGDMATAQRMVNEVARRKSETSLAKEKSDSVWQKGQNGQFTTFYVAGDSYNAHRSIRDHSGMEFVELDFGKNKSDDSDPFSKTGEGHGITIMRKASSILAELLYKEINGLGRPVVIRARESEPSRVKLYERFVSKLVATNPLLEATRFKREGFSWHSIEIKSADPITRDADGNVIPLSQRFNPESKSILHAPAPMSESEITHREAGFDSPKAAREAYDKDGLHDAGESIDEYLQRKHCFGLTSLE